MSCVENDQRIRRLGIFVFYDASGIVDGYVQELLWGIQSGLDRLVIIVNGIVTDTSKHRLEKYSDDIFIRENKGFDAGGYKDAFEYFLAEEDWNLWEEVVLFNDTFYGPILPWEQVFEKMAKEKADFWGLSRYPGKTSDSDDIDFPSHIQSYFLVCRKRLVLSPSFWLFWNTLEYPAKRSDATKNYEVRFTTYFEEKGFCWKAYTDVCGKRIDLNHGGSPYMYYACELIRELRFPIVKRNALTITNFIKAKEALDYIEENTDYNVELIYRHLNRLSKEEHLKAFNPLKLELFYQAHNRVYIYGHGEYGKNVAAFFDYMGWKYEGFLVSVKNEPDKNIHTFHDVKFSNNDGIVLALGPRAYKEVYPVIKKKLDASQLFLG